MTPMKTCSEIRLENLKKLIERAGSLQSVADTLEKSHAQISQINTQAKHSKTGKPRTIGDDIARLIEEKFGLEVGWMDNVHPTAAITPISLSRDDFWPFSVPIEHVRALASSDIGMIDTYIQGIVDTRRLDARKSG